VVAVGSLQPSEGTIGSNEFSEDSSDEKGKKEAPREGEKGVQQRGKK